MDEIQIVFALAVIYATYRWWSRPSNATSGTTASNSGTNASSSSTPPAAGGDNAANERMNTLATNTVPDASVAQVQAMFPQLGDREIRWEFVRSGRVKTVEQVVQYLLDSPASQPPAWFMAPRVAAESVPRSKAKHESFIQRLGLKAEADEQDKEFAAQASGEAMVDSSATITPTSRKGKSTDRQLVDQWRSMTMKEKKAKLVLAARRRILEKDLKARAMV